MTTKIFYPTASGDENLLPFATGVFPYDNNWQAILLHGVGKFSTEHEGLVVYKDDDGDLFMVDGTTKTALGNYVRVFFQQLATT